MKNFVQWMSKSALVASSRSEPAATFLYKIIVEKVMAKKKVKEEEDIFSALAEETGADVLSEQDPVKYFVDTGNLALNFICSGKYIDGGIPGSRLTEVFGEESSAKSLIATNVLYGCQKLGGYAIILDTENTMNSEFAANASHLDTRKVLIYNPPSLESAFKKIHTVVEKIRARDKESPIVVVYDSITVSASDRELREIELPEEYTEAQFKSIVGAKEQPGERAKICSREFRKITPMLDSKNVTLLIVNQLRSQIGVMFGDPNTTGGGGKALKYYATCRLATASAKRIVEKIDGVKLETPIGVNINVSNKKNKAYKPYMATKGLQLFFDKGINPITGLLTIFLQDKRVDVRGSGNFSVRDAYLPEGVKEYNFKSSVERNDVPIKLLLECPALVGAKTGEEVSNYLSAFDAAIQQSASKDVQENDVSEDNDD